MSDCQTCKHRDEQYKIHGECKLRDFYKDEENGFKEICGSYKVDMLKLAGHICCSLPKEK